MMINLNCATLVSLIYDRSEEHLSRTIRVLHYMRSIARFGHVLLFSACEVKEPLHFVVQIPPMDIVGLQTFQIRIVPQFISTPFMMMCHDDGFILQPELWTNEFLQYDYIGAPWGDGVVGNEGFSLQSQKSLWAKSNLPFADTNQGDEFMCRTHRERMIGSGVKFAPFELAAKFSTETVGNAYPSFGFHGRTHSPDKYKKGWELIEAFEQKEKG